MPAARPSNTPAPHKHLTFRSTCFDCRKLQTEWYTRLARHGFADKELRRDKDGQLTGELFDAYLGTRDAERSIVSLDSAESGGYDSDNGDRDNAALSENLDIFGEPTTVWDTPVASRWRFYSSEVQQLPAGYKHRAFLEAWAETGGDVVNAAKETGLSRWHGRESVRKFKNRLRKLGRLR